MSVADGQFGQQERRNIALTHQILNKWRVIDQPQYFNSSPLARQANQCFVCECMSESIGHIKFERYDKRIINNNNTIIHHQHHRQMNRQIEQEICSPTYLCVYLWTSLTPNNEFLLLLLLHKRKFNIPFHSAHIEYNAIFREFSAMTIWCIRAWLQQQQQQKYQTSSMTHHHELNIESCAHRIATSNT